jgi:hypothetical protein
MVVTEGRARDWGKRWFIAPSHRLNQGFDIWETWEGMAALAMVLRLCKWSWSHLSASWLRCCCVCAYCVCVHCQRSCGLVFVTWLPGSELQETRVTVWMLALVRDRCQSCLPWRPPCYTHSSWEGRSPWLWCGVRRRYWVEFFALISAGISVVSRLLDATTVDQYWHFIT